MPPSFTLNNATTSKYNHTPLSLTQTMFLVFLLLFLNPLPYAFALNQEGLYLLQVKQSLSDPTNALSSWNRRDDTPCNWQGISCHSPTARVQSVDLSDFQLVGPFPLFLCRLPYLRSISLANNSINSSLPLDLSTCQNLTTLDLSQNLLVGSLPPSLPNITTLENLILYGNNFSGEIPATFGQFQRLRCLNLAGNLLDATIPAILGNISTLEELDLAYNPFSPSHIPSELGNLTNLEQLFLAGCNLVGQIPSSFGRLVSLRNLDLSLNQLSGSIPSSISQLKSIEQIELYNNSLSGELPLNMGNLTTLKRFDAAMNELTGTIPTGLCGLQLESLNLYNNRLEGTLPESITVSKKLQELKLFNNKLSGPLPSQLGVNSPLQSLDVSYNQFSDELPENLCAKGQLGDIILIFNSFSGEIPESLGKCQSLGRVRFKHNRFSGRVPDGFWGLPRVFLLELAENSFSGEISKSISSAHNLSILSISKNRFSGSLPDEIGSLETLVEMSASGNEFTGHIPLSLVKLKQLVRLDLSENEINGRIPEGIKECMSLNELNLANNRLSGSIPGDIGSLPVLNYLDLSSNSFSGKVPIELQNLKLNVFNLSNNQLSGELPPFYAKENYKNSFLGNPGLCGDLEGLCRKISRSKNQTNMWILRSIFVLAGLVFVVGVVWFFMKYRSFKKNKKRATVTKWRSFHKIGFSEYEITDCLKEENVIGSGGSGKVYKVVLSNGDAVAVKKLSGVKKEDSLSAADMERDEFETEVEMLGKIRHKNIVRLWCCCITGDDKLLVYEYMPNGSLGDLLHSSKGGLLDWPTRYKIALDAAEGLSYLHHDCVPPIVHRDVKSNNILLDHEFSARVADFGVAKIVKGVGKGAESMSVIAGSCGYIAPEYAYTLRVNEKSDIYSFGVVILELVTGKPPTDPEFGEEDMVKWVCATYNQKGVDQVIDPRLDSTYKEEICRVLDIGILCTDALPINRLSMRKVVKLLQEAGGENKLKANQDGNLSPYYCYYEEASDQASLV
ncbi:Receptor-like protein kinase HSL1 [Gossypium arboreum]|uniref:non-specific serine/threonine protein kinase n=2 Tax=Gossypium arboreum TaxID=29729 RepID=A0A0B0NDK1_GOSAR|nr:receptor-like protein kinase HSL1 [Gossypium arboreum]KHG10910.1 Receptor-like protein kinase HSL1 [Gossypium arboreum]